MGHGTHRHLSVVHPAEHLRAQLGAASANSGAIELQKALRGGPATAAGQPPKASPKAAWPGDGRSKFGKSMKNWICDWKMDGKIIVHWKGLGETTSLESMVFTHKISHHPSLTKVS